MNIKTDMTQIKGILDATYNFDAMSLAIYYDKEVDLDLIKLSVLGKIDERMLHEAIQIVNFYSM